ncbi:MAG TPA: hypothetical protein PLA87_09145 [Pseudomonadota bacterium]|nr:hypothetical protein [Pseudomonadota bacterium]
MRTPNMNVEPMLLSGDRQQTVLLGLSLVLVAIGATLSRSLSWGWVFAALGAALLLLIAWSQLRRPLPARRLEVDAPLEPQNLKEFLDRGRQRMRQGEPQQAREDLLQALELAQQSSDAESSTTTPPELLSEIHGLLGDLALELGHPEDALHCYQDQLQVAQSHPQGDESLPLLNLSLWHAQHGQLEQADRLLAELQACTQRPSHYHALRRLGHLYLHLGKQERALHVFREILVQVQEQHQAAVEATALYDVGMALRQVGELRLSRMFLRISANRARLTGERRIEALVNWELGQLHAQTGEHALAIAALESSLDYLDHIGYPRTAPDYLRNEELLRDVRNKLN